MSAQVVFDCDDLKKEIFSYCLPQYPKVTKKMILQKKHSWMELDMSTGEGDISNIVAFPQWKVDWCDTLHILNRNIKIRADMQTIAELYPLWSPSFAKLHYGGKKEDY